MAIQSSSEDTFYNYNTLMLHVFILAREKLSKELFALIGHQPQQQDCELWHNFYEAG